MKTLIWKREGKEWRLYDGDFAVMKIVPHDFGFSFPAYLPQRRKIKDSNRDYIIETDSELDAFHRWAMANVVHGEEQEITMDAELIAHLRHIAEVIEQEFQRSG